MGGCLLEVGGREMVLVDTFEVMVCNLGCLLMRLL